MTLKAPQIVWNNVMKVIVQPSKLVLAVPIWGGTFYFVAVNCSNLPFTFSDIDECNSTKPFTPCDQICENIPGSYNCSCQKGFNLVNGSRCKGIVTILLMFLQMISTGAWISKRWWNVAIKNNWQLGQGSTGWIFSCSLTCYEVTFIALGLLCCSYPTFFFPRIVSEYCYVSLD